MNLRELLTEIASRWVKAKAEVFTGHPVAKLVRQDLRESVKVAMLSDSSKFQIKSSPGAGNWADVPWLSILNPSITTSTQSGIYPVYLFRADGSGIYLSLGFGTTELQHQHGATGAREKAQELRSIIRSNDPRLERWNEKIDLKSVTNLGRSYEWASAGAIFYPLESIPEDNVLIDDLNELLEIYSNVNPNMNYHEKHTASYDNSIPKPFLLLAGVSGTGKTRFVREQVNHQYETYELVAVRPDWHEPSDLLGYVSRLGEQAEYVVTDVLKFIVKAWIEIEKAGVSLQGRAVVGEQAQQLQVRSFWLCLDEMNLAPVEQYFADYLSILETRKWDWTNDEFIYQCDPILNATQFDGIDQEKLKHELGLNDHGDLWQHFLDNGISIPFNLIVAGTVNMDETTHGFSRKVIDRALSFDFGEFFPNNIEEFFEAKTQPKKLSYPIYSQAKLVQFSLVTIDPDAEKTKAFFKVINMVLKGTPFELAFRAFNELCLSVISFNPQTDVELAAVFDDFLMCKVLPRIEGDEDKLLARNNTIAGQNVLEQLLLVLEKEFVDIWQGGRPDLLRENIIDSEQTIKVDCRARKKLTAMSEKINSGFVSFWP